MQPDELPEGWGVKQLGDCVAPKEIWNQRKNPRKRIRYVELAGIDNERGVIANYGEIEAASAPSRAKKVMRKGDVLFATTRPNLKNIAVVPADLDNEICSTGFCVLRPKPEEITTGWIYSVVRSDWFVSQVVRHDEKNAYPSVSDDEVCAVAIPVPPLAEQRRLVARIEALTGRLGKARQVRQAAIAETGTCLRAAVARAFADADESSNRPLGEVTGIIGGNSIPEDAPPASASEERVGLILAELQDDSGIPQINKKHLNPLQIPVLPEPEQRTIVARLDALRGKLDEFEDIPGSASLEGEIGRVEYLFTGCLVFALDKIRDVSTVADLWAGVGAYDLPDYALLERPPDMPKFPVQSALKPTNLILKAGGVWIDQAYAS